MSFLENVGVIIRQLFARFHIAYRLDPDPPVVYDGVAVRIARVVDEAGIVAVHRCIDDDVIVDGEEVCVMPPSFIVGVPRVGFFWREPLAGVFDQPRPFWDCLCGECAQSLDS